MKKPGIKTNKTNHRNCAWFLSALFKKNTGLKNGAGLTLIELLVVISIMMTMTAVVFVNYRPGNQQLALNRSASKLAQDIRRAQEMAMSSRAEGACDPITFRGRYGIKLSQNHPEYYILFADCSDNNEYVLGVDEAIQRVEFETGIRFEKVQYFVGGAQPWVPVGGGTPNINILFSPPDPERFIYTAPLGDPDHDPDLEDAERQRIRLRLDSGQFKNIYVNSAGLIYVE